MSSKRKVKHKSRLAKLLGTFSAGRSKTCAAFVVYSGHRLSRRLRVFPRPCKSKTESETFQYLINRLGCWWKTAGKGRVRAQADSGHADVLEAGTYCCGLHTVRTVLFFAKAVLINVEVAHSVRCMRLSVVLQDLLPMLCTVGTGFRADRSRFAA